MSGWRQATIHETEAVAPGLQRVRLTVPASVATAFHTPGQFVRVKCGELEVPFAIASAPGGHHFDFLVRTNGDVAQRLAGLPVGGVVELGLPEGPGFPLERTRGHSLLLVGTGTGWGPLRSVLLALKPRRAEWKRVTGLYGALTPEHVVFDEEFECWRRDDGIDVRVTVTEPLATWTGPIGRVQALVPEIAVADTYAFLCGQPEMTAEVTSLLVSRGVPPDRVSLNF